MESIRTRKTKKVEGKCRDEELEGKRRLKRIVEVEKWEKVGGRKRMWRGARKKEVEK